MNPTSSTNSGVSRCRTSQSSKVNEGQVEIDRLLEEDSSVDVAHQVFDELSEPSSCSNIDVVPGIDDEYTLSYDSECLDSSFCCDFGGDVVLGQQFQCLFVEEGQTSNACNMVDEMPSPNEVQGMVIAGVDSANKCPSIVTERVQEFHTDVNVAFFEERVSEVTMISSAHHVFDEIPKPTSSPSDFQASVAVGVDSQRYETGVVQAVAPCLRSNFGLVKEAREVSGCKWRSNASLSSACNVFDDMFKPECCPEVTQIVRAKIVESKFEVSSKPMAIVLYCVKDSVSCMELFLWWLPCIKPPDRISLSLDCILSDVGNAWEPYFGCVVDLVVPSSWAKNDYNCFCAGRMFVDTPCCPINGIADSLSELVFDPGGSLGVVSGKVGNRCGECEWQAQLGLKVAESLGDPSDEMFLINVPVQQWDSPLWFYTLEDKGVLRSEEMVQNTHNMRMAVHLDYPWSNGVILLCETKNFARAQLYCGVTICSGDVIRESSLDCSVFGVVDMKLEFPHFNPWGQGPHTHMRCVHIVHQGTAWEKMLESGLCKLGEHNVDTVFQILMKAAGVHGYGASDYGELSVVITAHSTKLANDKLLRKPFSHTGTIGLKDVLNDKGTWDRKLIEESPLFCFASVVFMGSYLFRVGYVFDPGGREYGFIGVLNQPKWGHLKDLRAAIKHCELATLNYSLPPWVASTKNAAHNITKASIKELQSAGVCSNYSAIRLVFDPGACDRNFLGNSSQFRCSIALFRGSCYVLCSNHVTEVSYLRYIILVFDPGGFSILEDKDRLKGTVLIHTKKGHYCLFSLFICILSFS